MPIGCSSLVPYLAAELHALQPRSVLDLGCGYGWAGAAVRQWVDGGVRPWRTRLVGVEAFAAYRSPQWDVYDEVVCADLVAWLKANDERWPVVLLLDVVEHFERGAGVEVLALARSRLTSGGRLYVGTPAVWFAQDATHGNGLERHRDLWTVADFTGLGAAILWDGTVDRWGNSMLLASFSAAGNP